MACFLVPGAEAVVTTIVQKTIGKEVAEKIKLKWLNTMLWGGVILLAVEHIWHGEVSPVPPFLTAMKNPEEIGVMLHEMVTNGLMMAATVTLIWVVMVAFSMAMTKKEIMIPKKVKA